jgi:hypothetical protein
VVLSVARPQKHAHFYAGRQLSCYDLDILLAALPNSGCMTMQAVEVLEDVLLWDAPDICFTRKDHLCMASYIFKVPCGVHVSGCLCSRTLHLQHKRGT